ncbi:MAG: DegQ family serine endoprotease [Immundisolibacter sp.]|uniref:DegQ family serine endoprotease n=1 Tax=Immundisolibacter sp. TaxID=1934948 RepID=UPI003EE375FF
MTRMRCVPLFVAAILILAGSRVQAALPEFTQLVKDVSPSIVNISTTQKVREQQMFPGMPLDPDDPRSELFRRFFGQPPGGQQRQARSLGSGFVISSDGIILTNAHVVKDADEILVKLSDHREEPAELVGLDERTDVAVLRIKAKGLPVVKIGDSDRLEVGEWVLAIGSPFGLEYTATAGIVSAVGRTLPSDAYVPFIQTDAAVNPGNSGGPLFNTQGQVIGINSQIYSRTGGSVGLSFAIPIKVAIRAAQQIEKSGHASHGYLGVTVQPVTLTLAQSFGLDRPRGALVAEVTPKGPAAKAGLGAGDVILAFNGVPLADAGDLPPLVGSADVGAKVSLRLLRDGKERTLQATVGALPNSDVVASSGAGRSEPAQGGPLKLAVVDLDELQRQQLEVPVGGVLVVAVGDGPAARAGLARGDVIMRVGEDVVKNASHFKALTGKLAAGRVVPLLVQRRGNPLFLALTVPKD